MSLIDSFAHTIDGKGRVVLPSHYRDEFLPEAVLQLKGDHLALYTASTWMDYLAQLRDQRTKGNLTRREFNMILGASSEVKQDGQGRIMLAPRFREQIGLDREVVIQGADDYLALYHPDTVAGDEAPDLADVMSRLDEMGL